MRFRILLTVYAADLLLTACAQEATHDDIINATPTLPDPHHHVVNVNNNGLGPQNATEFKAVEVVADRDLKQESAITNQDETFRAFSTCDQTCRVLFDEISTSKRYELQASSFLPGRPFSDLVWIAGEILVFDQWTQPHHGVHYAIDVREKKLILASPFPDEVP